MRDDSVRRKLQLDITRNDETKKSQWRLKPMKADDTLTRKALEECKKCQSEYRVLENAVGDCIYHPGKQDVSCFIFVRVILTGIPSTRPKDERL